MSYVLRIEHDIPHACSRSLYFIVAYVVKTSSWNSNHGRDASWRDIPNVSF